MIQYIVFFGLVITTFVLLAWQMGRLFGRHRAVGYAMVVSVLAAMIASYMIRANSAYMVPGWVGWYAFGMVGWMSFAVLLFWLFGSARFVGTKLLGTPVDVRPADEGSDESRQGQDNGQSGSVAHELPALSRRGLLALPVRSFAVAGASVLSAVSVANARAIPPVREVNVAMPRWPQDIPPLKIAQLSDIHVGPTIGGDFVRGVVEATNKLGADMVVITGDLVDGSVEALTEDVAPLADLRARYGVYFCTGNHEYYSGVDQWLKHLPSLGVEVLHNEHVSVEHEGARINLAGITDHRAERFGDRHRSDPEAAARGLDPEAIANICLAHQPRSFAKVAQTPFELQLSGHTHGGQFAPWNWVVYLAQPFVWGLHRQDDTQIYVSRGTGYWGPPMRLGAPSEITLLTVGAA